MDTTVKQVGGGHRPDQGFTLVEAVLIIVIIGLVSAIGLPRLAIAKQSADLQSARRVATNMYVTARSVAVQTNRYTRLKFVGNRAVVLASPRLDGPASGVDDTVGVVQDFQALYGATLETTTDSLVVDPRGLAAAAEAATVKLSKGGNTATIRISRYGRVTR